MITSFSCAYVTGEAVTPQTPTATVINITPSKAFELIFTSSSLSNPIIIDVRTPQEYADGHIFQTNIFNIDFNSPAFRAEIGKLDKNKTYVVYCRTGVRSAAASKIMAELGFIHVYNMTGGITDWQTAGLPLVK